jgi:hypothetical protein
MRFLFLIIPCFPLLLSAQINESDTLPLKARLGITGIWQGGNVETVIFRAKSDISCIPFRRWVFKTQNSYVYQAFGGQKADEDILSLNFLYFNPQKRIYPLLLGFASTNFRREIDLRILLGTGITFQLLDKPHAWLKVAVSTEYEQTNFGRKTFNRMGYNGSSEINTLRGTFWVNGRYALFQKQLVFTHEFYIQPSLEQADNFRWQADLALELPLWKYLNFKVNYLHTFESIVISNQQQEDHILTFGFTLKSY